MVSGDDGLDVGGEPAAAGKEVEIVAHRPYIAVRLAGVIRPVQAAGSTGHRGNVG